MQQLTGSNRQISSYTSIDATFQQQQQSNTNIGQHNTVNNDKLMLKEISKKILSNQKEGQFNSKIISPLQNMETINWMKKRKCSVSKRYLGCQDDVLQNDLIRTIYETITYCCHTPLLNVNDFIFTSKKYGFPISPDIIHLIYYKLDKDRDNALNMEEFKQIFLNEELNKYYLQNQGKHSKNKTNIKQKLNYSKDSKGTNSSVKQTVGKSTDFSSVIRKQQEDSVVETKKNNDEPSQFLNTSNNSQRILQLLSEKDEDQFEEASIAIMPQQQEQPNTTLQQKKQTKQLLKKVDSPHSATSILKHGLMPIKKEYQPSIMGGTKNQASNQQIQSQKQLNFQQLQNQQQLVFTPCSLGQHITYLAYMINRSQLLTCVANKSNEATERMLGIGLLFGILENVGNNQILNETQKRIIRKFKENQQQKLSQVETVNNSKLLQQDKLTEKSQTNANTTDMERTQSTLQFPVQQSQPKTMENNQPDKKSVQILDQSQQPQINKSELINIQQANEDQHQHEKSQEKINDSTDLKEQNPEIQPNIDKKNISYSQKKPFNINYCLYNSYNYKNKGSRYQAKTGAHGFSSTTSNKSEFFFPKINSNFLIQKSYEKQQKQPDVTAESSLLEQNTDSVRFSDRQTKQCNNSKQDYDQYSENQTNQENFYQILNEEVSEVIQKAQEQGTWNAQQEFNSMIHNRSKNSVSNLFITNSNQLNNSKHNESLPAIMTPKQNTVANDKLIQLIKPGSLQINKYKLSNDGQMQYTGQLPMTYSFSVNNNLKKISLNSSYRNLNQKVNHNLKLIDQLMNYHIQDQMEDQKMQKMRDLVNYKGKPIVVTDSDNLNRDNFLEDINNSKFTAKNDNYSDQKKMVSVLSELKINLPKSYNNNQ